MKINPVKSRNIRNAILQAYNNFNSEECDWQQGMNVLAQLLGYKIEKIESKPCTVAEFTELVRKQKEEESNKLSMVYKETKLLKKEQLDRITLKCHEVPNTLTAY